MSVQAGTVNTKTVQGRRSLQFESLQEARQEAERLVAGRVRNLGNWTLGQVLKHLAVGMDLAVDGSDYKPPFFIRMMGPLIKRSIFKKGMPPGFKLPPELARVLTPPEDTTAEQGLEAFRESLARYESAEQLQPHSVFGKLTRSEWDRLMIRHAEMHLSFIVPVQ